MGGGGTVTPSPFDFWLVTLDLDLNCDNLSACLQRIFTFLRNFEGRCLEFWSSKNELEWLEKPPDKLWIIYLSLYWPRSASPDWLLMMITFAVDNVDWRQQENIWTICCLLQGLVVLWLGLKIFSFIAHTKYYFIAKILEDKIWGQLKIKLIS